MCCHVNHLNAKQTPSIISCSDVLIVFYFRTHFLIVCMIGLGRALRAEGSSDDEWVHDPATRRAVGSVTHVVWRTFFHYWWWRWGRHVLLRRDVDADTAVLWWLVPWSWVGPARQSSFFFFACEKLSYVNHCTIPRTLAADERSAIHTIQWRRSFTSEAKKIVLLILSSFYFIFIAI